MKYQKSIAKAILQLRNLYWEIFDADRILYISGAIHVNCTRLDFTNNNLGDDLNLPLAEALTGRRVIPRRFSLLPREKNYYLMIGSIIADYSSKKAIIWGAGLIQPAEYIRPPEKVCAVRGPLTRSELLKHGIDCPEIYGDPALLLPKIYHHEVEKRHPVGLIAHEVDAANPFVVEWKRAGRHCLDLKNYGHWHHFIEDLCSCETILSSSLHGLILSDSYGIPSRRIILSGKITGGNFKYEDYYLSFRTGCPAPSSACERSIKEWRQLILEEWSPQPPDMGDRLLRACPLPLLDKYVRR